MPGEVMGGVLQATKDQGPIVTVALVSLGLCGLFALAVLYGAFRYLSKREAAADKRASDASEATLEVQKLHNDKFERMGGLLSETIKGFQHSSAMQTAAITSALEKSSAVMERTERTMGRVVEVVPMMRMNGVQQ